LPFPILHGRVISFTMFRPKSPFKKRVSKGDEGEPVRPLTSYESVQEFQELQKQQHLANGNAWAQQKERARTTSVSFSSHLESHNNTLIRAAG
jgi:hypothetical protein